jgi:hypothetical protein
MSALTDRLDRFVRWFFDSSPTPPVIEFEEAGHAARDERATRARQEKGSVPRGRHNLRRTRSHSQQRARA